MGSLGVEEVVRRKKAMWLYPKINGFKPPERWGHSACFFDGLLYVFGGCCGGLHFSDVLTLNLDTMTWTSLKTIGQKPGTRDSHSATLVGYKMLVFGGTNGSKKVNDLHILDLKTKEWSKPNCKGIPPSPRESHTASVIGNERLVIFGGSGEGEANYLNDVHELDLKSMTWTSPEVKGDPPAPRDSHTAVAIGNKLLVHGGDCGDCYHGEVDILNMDALTWSRLAVHGPSPGVRAGHAAVNIGSKVYIIGGVGDKQYYSDVWVLDVSTCSWTQLDTRGQQPQGRFSHTALVTNNDIAVYGGCGEDELPLNELLILQLGLEHPNCRYNISMCKIFGSHWNQEKRKFLRGAENMQKSKVLKNGEMNQRSCQLEVEPRSPTLQVLDNSSHVKRRRVFTDAKISEVESEQEEHSLSLSQHSSPSQSDQERNTIQKGQHHPAIVTDSKHSQRSPRDVNFLKTEEYLRVVPPQRQEVQFLGVDQKRHIVPHLIGADVRGTVDGAFDSGYLMTANVNGQIFRGVLFATVPGVGVPRPSSVHPPINTAFPIHISPTPKSVVGPLDCGHHSRRQSHPGPPSLESQPARLNNSDLQGVILTLGGPGGGAGSGS